MLSTPYDPARIRVKAAILGNSAATPVARDLVDVFTEVAYQHAEHPAIIHNGRVLSYSQLNALVRAAALRIGPHPGVVGVLTTRSPGAIIGLLGVLAAGGTYCPIDPTFPAIRQRAMLSAAGCRTVLAAEPGLSSPAGVRLLDLADLPEPTGTQPGTVADPEDPAYILFTSGSTGEPKPVVTPRRAIAATVGSLHELFGLTSADRVLQFASLNWDTCLEEILPTLTTGASLVFHDEAYTGSLPRFLRMIENERITVLDLPTAFWHELVHHLREDRAALPECVRLMVIGGEALSSARLADWCDLDTGRIRLVNTYGCTETTLITHAVDLHGPCAPRFETPWDKTTRAPIGWSLPHVLEHVSDEGELLVGGPCLALGYLGLPEATEARFVAVDRVHSNTGVHTSTGDHAGRYFRTGDRVSQSRDGMLTHQGRLDDEVKVRGIRVDPAEIEAQIAGHPQVSAVAVAGVAVADRTTLVAYVVPRPHANVSTLAADVLAYLRARVPGHLVPSRITVVPKLVYTPSGKVDRARSHQRHWPTTRSRSPSMSVDGVMDIFRRVLETTEITADSDFFALGGDSLSATRVLSAVARAYGAELTFEDFLMAATPDALAKKIAWMAP